MQLCPLLIDSCLRRLRNVPLVSLHLSQACRDPALWPDFRAQNADFQTDDRWRSFLRWLVPRASGLQTLRFDEADVCMCII